MTTTLTNDQITAGAAVLCDHGQPIGRNAAIAVFDAMRAASPQVADIAELRREIGKAASGACNCKAKGGPLRQDHDYACRYRALDGAMEFIDAIAASRRVSAPASAGQAAPARPESLKGMAVSVDVSTCDEDGGNRIFAELTGETGSDGTTLLAIETSRNFSGQPAEGAGQAGQVANDCETCSGSGVVGFPPDQYEHCTDCATERAAAPADDRPCTEQMRGAGLPAPRTCPTCGLGPCKFATHQPSAQVKP